MNHDANHAFDPFAGPEIVATAPSTEPQRELWTATRLGDEASLAFNESVTLRFHGALDVEALKGAVREVQERHEALRAVFSPDGLTQLFTAATAPLDVVDTDEAGLARLLTQAVGTPFDLEKGPLARFQLARLGPREHALVFTAHHLVCDGWSSGVLVRELAASYRARLRGEPARLPPAASFAAYARAAPDREQLANDEAYWLRQLAGELPVLELPSDRARPALKTFRARREDVRLDQGLVQRLRAGAARQRASLFTLLLAGFDALLHRLTGQEDLVVGIPAAGQAAIGAETLVGHCVNTLPMRVRLHGRQRFDELVTAVRSAMLDGLEHQQLTFGALLRKLPVARDPSRLPLVSVAFNLDRGLEPEAFAFEGAQTSLSTNPRAFENFDLFVNAVELPDEIVLECQYNTDLYERDTVRRWLAAYALMLDAAAREPATELGLLPVVPPDDERQLAAWNAQSAHDYPRELCAHELFERQAARTPEAVAVEHDGRELRYAELEARANALARRLRAAGVRRGTLVGHCVERSLDLFVALLGILKAGGAYVPLDPGYPAERLAYMVSDSGMRVVVTQRKLRAELPLAGAEALCLEDVLEDPGQSSAALPRDDASAAPDSPAYVLYTSGSTGKPKGVLVPHRALVNLLTSVQRTPGLGPADVVLAITTLSFDIAASEVLLPLTVGARIVLATRDVASDGASLLRLLRSRGVTFVDATPATWRLLLAAGWTGGEGLKAICTGEAMPRELGEELGRRTASLWNGYGPTETTVWSTFWEVPRTLERVLIGKPIANTQAHVLDARRQPVPIGVPGELYIGGDGVSLGYLNRPDLTAERFLDDAVRGRLYRTGDLCRWLPDGNLECLGRTDNQVKLRGFRIELGEIDDALSHHPAVRAAAVIKREDEPGNPRLVAYVALRDGHPADDAGLRAFLKSTLPDYMVPSAFVRLGALPLTPSGKIDRKALPAPSSEAVRPSGDFVAPRTKAELLVAELWREALRVGRLSATDDFFALGGHSLLASQVLARLARDHGVELSFRTLFEAPVLSAFAALVETRQASGGGSAAAAIPRHEGPAPLSLAQERLWMLEELDASQKLVHALPAAWRLSGPLDPALLGRCLGEIARRHDPLRTAVRVEGGQPVQAVEATVDLPLPLHDLSQAPSPEDALARLLDAEAQKTYDVARPPLFRALLARLRADEHALFIQPHNLVWDGWSFDLFLRELAALYPALADGRPSPLPPLPVRYGDYAVWQRAHLATPGLEAQIAWWREQLAGAPAGLELPADRRRPAASDLRAGNRGVQLPRAMVDALTALARENGATLFMVLAAAFDVLLHRYTGATDLLIGTPVRGRNRPELEDLIGPFINAVVLRTRLSPTLTFRELLKRVRETTLDSFSRQDVPLEALGANAPAVRVFFSLQDARNRPPSIGPCQVHQLHVLPPAAANDLMLWMMETTNGLLAMANYRADLFDGATIERLLRHFQSLLAAALRDPGARLCDLPLADEAERAALASFSRPAPKPPSLPAQLRARALESAPFLIGRDHALPARILLERANGAAAALVAQGLAPGSRVGVSLHPGAELLAALFGCWSAGGVAVLLDPGLPAERLAALRARMKLEALIGRGPPGALDPASFAERAEAPPAREPHPLAVVFADGQGEAVREVELSHARLAALAAAVASDLGLSSRDLVVSTAAADSDSALLEWMAALSCGARLALAAPEPGALAPALSAGATCVFAPAQALRLLASSGWKPAAAGFLPVSTAGALPEGLAEKGGGAALRVYPEARLAALVARGDDALEPVRAGRAVAGVLLELRDPEGSAPALGVPGDLVLDGTATGDRARLLASGAVEIVRAAEDRAFIRGRRVDLAAVGAALQRHPAVARAAATVAGAPEGVLVGWVVYRNGEAPTDSELRRELRRTLPEPAIPRLFVELPSLPLRPDGAIDRARLPPVPGGDAGPGFAEPRTDAERLIASIWREALRVDRVGLYDNFFDLGGHSLLAFEVVTRIEQATGHRISPRVLLLSSLEQAAAELAGAPVTTSGAPAAHEPFAARMLRRLKGIVSAR